MRVLLVMSAASRRAFAVATREGSGGGGDLAVMRELRKVVDGYGRC